MVIWMGANKIKSTGSPTIFCFPRLHSTCFAHRFSYSSAIHGSLFTGYVICRLDREKGILALVVTIISCPPPPPPPPAIRSARYITVEPQSSKQSRFLIIEKLHEHWCGLPCCYFYHFKGRLPTTIAKMHCHLWNSK